MEKHFECCDKGKDATQVMSIVRNGVTEYSRYCEYCKKQTAFYKTLDPIVKEWKELCQQTK